MVTLIPEQVAGRIITIQEALAASHVLVHDRERLIAEQSQLWDEVFPGKPYEEIRALTNAFMLPN
jgi:hypothetical protein